MSDQPPAGLPTDTGEEESPCGDGSPYNGKLGLRVAAIFIILVTSLFGTLLPIVLARLTGRGQAPLYPSYGFFTIVKYFGSGVIIATAFIHLLAPGSEALGSECLASTGWGIYPYSFAFAMASMFTLFVVEIFAFRIGEALLRKWGLAGTDVHAHADDHNHSHGHGIGRDHSTTARGVVNEERDGEVKRVDEEEADSGKGNSLKGEKDGVKTDEMIAEEHEISPSTAMAQIVGVAILEFGVIFHSLIIGLTLAVDEDFVTLFVVLIFHQMFEGLGLGSRLAYLHFPSGYRWIPWAAGVIYACITPLGVAIGLGVRETYNPESQTASIVAGTLDSISAGILLYTGLVELLAHDFIFNPVMAKAPLSRVAFSIGCVLLGAGLMALLGRWA